MAPLYLSIWEKEGNFKYKDYSVKLVDKVEKRSGDERI
jgi:hypothetical protein